MRKPRGQGSMDMVDDLLGFGRPKKTAPAPAPEPVK